MAMAVPFAVRSRYPGSMPTLFDPLHWLATKGAEASLTPAGEVKLLFDQHTPQKTRVGIRRVISRYEGLLRLQLDVPKGTRPRTVQQLLAAGKIRLVEGRYVRASQKTKNNTR